MRTACACTHADLCQSFIGLVLLCNFAANILEAERAALGATESELAAYELLDMCFSFFYVLELTINIWGSWFWDFVSDWWNIFDLVVVCTSVLELVYYYLVNSGRININVLRLLRVFRVLRLFNKFPDMQRVITALTASLKPVLTAFIILIVVISIYAIIGVNLYSKYYPERYSSFVLGWFTMLGVATGDSWTAEALILSGRMLRHEEHKKRAGRRLRASGVREEGEVEEPVVDGLPAGPGSESKWGAAVPTLQHPQGFVSDLDEPGMRFGVASADVAPPDAAGPSAVRRGESTAEEALATEGEAGPETMAAGGVEFLTQIDLSVMLYFVSFVFFGSIIAINVVVAVMLEGFVSSLNADETAKRLEMEARNHQKIAGPLDPVLSTLANFTSPSHLESQIDLLFQLFDVDDSGSLSYDEMRLGLGKLGCVMHWLYGVCALAVARQERGRACSRDGV